MPGVPEDLDVFHLPHGQMKQIVHSIEDEASVHHFVVSHLNIIALHALYAFRAIALVFSASPTLE